MKFVRTTAKIAWNMVNCVLSSFKLYRIMFRRKDFCYVAGSRALVAEKAYVRDGRRVILIGMIHVGAAEFYEQIRNDFKDSKAIALTEGVSDVHGLSSKEFHYEGVSGYFGLVKQSRDLFPLDRNADLDISELSKDLPRFLRAVGTCFRLLSPHEMAKAIKMTFDESTEECEFLKLKAPSLENIDLLTSRNDRLFELLELEIQNNDVIVPWGAKHLRDIENRLFAIGFKLEATKERFVCNWVGAVKHYVKRVYEEYQLLAKK
jgi:hypothetical protein